MAEQYSTLCNNVGDTLCRLEKSVIEHEKYEGAIEQIRADVGQIQATLTGLHDAGYDIESLKKNQETTEVS